jgi:hypothetical protein
MHQSFDHGGVGTLDGRERRRIRYRVVRLLDAPDELLSSEIGLLDEGDEVELLERSGAYWLVLCPDGGRGAAASARLNCGNMSVSPPASGR